MTSVFFPVELENNIRFSFFEKSIIKFLFNFKVNFFIFNTEETKSSIIPIYYISHIQKAHIHDTGFISQIKELI